MPYKCLKARRSRCTAHDVVAISCLKRRILHYNLKTGKLLIPQSLLNDKQKFSPPVDVKEIMGDLKGVWRSQHVKHLAPEQHSE